LSPPPQVARSYLEGGLASAAIRHRSAVSTLWDPIRSAFGVMTPSMQLDA